MPHIKSKNKVKNCTEEEMKADGITYGMTQYQKTMEKREKENSKDSEQKNKKGKNIETYAREIDQQVSNR